MDGFHPGPGSGDRSVSQTNDQFYHLIMGSYSQFEVDSMRRNAENIERNTTVKGVIERRQAALEGTVDDTLDSLAQLDWEWDKRYHERFGGEPPIPPGWTSA